MQRIFDFLKHEFLKMLPPTIYFFVVLHVILFARNLIAGEWGGTLMSSALATIGALIVGKSILIADSLPVFLRLEKKRLIYDVAARSVIYMTIALVLQFLEEFIPMLFKHEGLTEATQHVVGEINWPKFWVSHLLIFVFLLFYTTITGMARATKYGTVLAALLGPLPPNVVSDREVSKAH